MATDKPGKGAALLIKINPVNMRTLALEIEGTAPLMQHRMSQKAIAKIRATQEAGQKAKGKKVREPRDFEGDFRGALHISTDGWIGVPASAFRNACIDVCRMVDIKMTHARMSIFVEADGFDKIDGQPLVRLIADEPEMNVMPARNDNGGLDLRARPMWRTWSVKLRLRYDADQFTENDVANLLERAGMQVGIQEGRPFSKESNGMGYGTFRLTRGAK
jgi:hypothetical protein